jgi:F0F1-type ATP synthase membrane subunit c/vacuolar-type H+-ATPase subunit K
MANQDQASPRKSKTVLKYSFAAIVGGVVTAIAAAIIGVISSSYIEISFKDPSAIGTWNEWMDLHVDVIRPKVYRAYYGVNDNGKTVVWDSKLSLKYFSLTNKILGVELERQRGAKFALAGFWRDDLIVLAHRGEKGGQAINVVRLFSGTGAALSAFAGYTVHEDWKYDGTDSAWIIKCPLLVLDEELAQKTYVDRATLLKDFPFLTTKCIEFVMPTSLLKVVQEPNSVDEIVGTVLKEKPSK